jgi:hypothetical protein
MSTQPVDVPRLIRIATLLFAILAGSLVYFAYEPSVDGAQTKLEDGQAQLRSEDVAFAEIPRLRAERGALSRRYDPIFALNAQASFLRELAQTVRRHHVTLVSTSVEADASPANEAATALPALLRQTHVSLELRGTYPHLLATVAEVSRGPNIVGAGEPALRRADGAIVATVPVTIYEPAQGTAP